MSLYSELVLLKGNFLKALPINLSNVLSKNMFFYNSVENQIKLMTIKCSMVASNLM